MRKQQIIILGIVFGISLLGLIILQTSYFQTAYEVKKEQFFYSANRAMDVLGGGQVQGRYEHYEFQRAIREAGSAAGFPKK